MSEQSEHIDANIQDGGRRKRVAKKVKKADPKKKTKKGGDALSEQLTGLAVPFAFLLAKQGLEALKSNKKKSASPKKSARRATMAGGSDVSGADLLENVAAPANLQGGAKKKTKKPKHKKGGECLSCNNSVASQIGGASSLRNLEKLRKNIDNFLKKY